MTGLKKRDEQDINNQYVCPMNQADVLKQKLYLLFVLTSKLKAEKSRNNSTSERKEQDASQKSIIPQLLLKRTMCKHSP